MKKNFKKLFAILMTVAVVLSMTMPAMAAEINDEGHSTGYTLTIAEGEKNAGTTYNIYRVYSATVSTGVEGKIGAVYKIAPGFEGLVGDYGEESPTITKENLQDVIAAALPLSASASPAYSGGAGKYDVTPGYYLIVATGKAAANEEEGKKDKGVDGGTVTSPCLVAVPGFDTVNSNGSGGNVSDDVTVTPKASDTFLDKKISGGSTSTELGANGNTSTVAIGGTVQYTIESTIPAYGEDVKKEDIVYKITDLAETSLDFNEIVSVMVDKTEVSSDMYEFTKDAHGFTMNFHYDKLTAPESGIVAGSKITIIATFTLNNTAVISDPNTNDVQLEYTNNYYAETDKTSTLKDKVDTYTFGFGIQKINSDGKAPIKGAEFEVKNVEGEVVARIVGAAEEEGKVTITVYKPATEPTEVLFETTVEDTGSYVFKGLDAGVYTVTETKAPSGYKQLTEDISVTITATKNESDQYEGAYTVTADGKTGVDSIEVDTLKAHGFQIENTQGTTLPGTGGIGTTIFTFGGLALIVLAGILLVVYTRKQKKA